MFSSFNFDMYPAANTKRQKVVRDATRTSENLEVFQGIGKIEYKPEAILTFDEQLSFQYFNATERLHGRPMEDWLRPSLCYEDYANLFSQQSILKASELRPTLDSSKQNFRILFELCLKVSVKLWCGFTNNFVPEGETFEDTQKNYELIGDVINEYQQKTGIRPLWIGVNFTHKRYINGAMTNSDLNVVAYACYQVKKAMDLSHKLNADSFVISTSAEVYECNILTDIAKELKQFVKFLKHVVDYREKIGFRGQLLLQFCGNSTKSLPNREKVAYSRSAFGIMLLLKQFNFDRHFKVIAAPGHDFDIVNAYGCLGGVIIKEKGTKQDKLAMTLMLKTLLEKGGFGQMGTFIDLSQEDNCLESRDVLERCIETLDAYAKAFRCAVKLVNDVQVNKSLQASCASLQTAWGVNFMTGEGDFGECEQMVKKLFEGNVNVTPTKYQHWTTLIKRFLDHSTNFQTN